MNSTATSSNAFSYDEFVKRNIGFVTETEQKKLLASSILIVGVGGMGGVALQCLLRSGIGRFVIADIDVFEVSNFNRQIFSNMDTLGLDKREATHKEILRINPHCQVESLGAEWLEKLEQILPTVDVVLNGCDDARATIQLMRVAKKFGKTVIDAFASPLPSVYVVHPSDPRPEELFGYPSVGKAFHHLTEDDARACAACEVEYVLAQSSSAKHVVLEIAAEMISGKRKRISFAPMVWATGILMSYEAVRVLLGKPGGPGPRGVFLNPWSQKFERARGGIWSGFKRLLVRRFLKKMSQVAVIGLVACAMSLLTGCLEATSSSFSDYFTSWTNSSGTNESAAHFLMGDFGGLNSDTLFTNALPWKVVASYLLVRENRRSGLPIQQSSLPKLLQKYGFITPKEIGNWPTSLPMPQLKTPAGLVHGMGNMPGAQVEISNVQCAACHAGTTYDRDGLPTLKLWLGMPNTSINIEGFTLEVFEALKEAVVSPTDMLSEVRQVYPDISPLEQTTLLATFAMVKDRVNQMAAQTGRPTPFSSGNPGVTNGVAALKKMLGVIDSSRYHSDETAFTSVPDLSDRHLRSSLLYDGVYSLKGEDPFRTLTRAQTPVTRLWSLSYIIGFFNVPVMGETTEQAEANLPKARLAVEFLENYRADRFPGPIDFTRAQRGSTAFALNCAACHGTYTGDLGNLKLGSFPNRLIPLQAIGTDPQRVNLITPEVADAVRKSRMGVYMDANLSHGYVAPILNGLWASAPYLHNASVPTLWQLMNPELRPSVFWVGGHALDFKQVGIRGAVDNQGVYSYPNGYQPWSTPFVYHTTDLGRSNRGHERQFQGLSQDEKLDLLEYLKLL